MTQPIRNEVFSAATMPAELTIRSLVDWFKAVSRLSIGMPTNMEVAYLNKAWAGGLRELATKLQVPPGWLSFSLNSLAEQELRLADVAVEEGSASLPLEEQ